MDVPSYCCAFSDFDLDTRKQWSDMCFPVSPNQNIFMQVLLISLIFAGLVFTVNVLDPTTSW